MKGSKSLRRYAIAALVNPLPNSVRSLLLQDLSFSESLILKPQFWFPLADGISLERHSLHDALVKAVAGKKTSRVLLRGRNQPVVVRLGYDLPDVAKITLENSTFSFHNADLLSSDQQTRIGGLRRILSFRPLLAEEASDWLSSVTDAALDTKNFSEFMDVIGETPEALISELMAPQQLSPEALVPRSQRYYERLIAPYEGSADFPSFIAKEMTDRRSWLLQENTSVALRRIAFSALWQPLIPFDILNGVSTGDLTPLLKAQDPFSLLFGFEMCVALFEKDPSLGDLGALFLQRLLHDNGSRGRLKIFAACAIVTSVWIRRGSAACSPPLFWTRLASFTHAGVLTQALSHMPDPDSFLNWALQSDLEEYLWHGTVDRREAPRWKPEWVSPEHLYAELVGRVRNAMAKVQEADLPLSWRELYGAAMKNLQDEGKVLATVFPGPFDDFAEQHNHALNGQIVEEAESALEAAHTLSEVQELIAIAYCGAASANIVKHVIRVLQLDHWEADWTKEVNSLGIASHLALSTKSEGLAQATIERCYKVMRVADQVEVVVDLFKIVGEVSAVQHDAQSYRQELSRHAFAICMATDDAEVLAQLLAIFDCLRHRDNRLAAALSRARAVCKVKIGRI